ncbi:MAG TPA: CDP-glucose 4,6-dehydratase [Pirellulales bacterium]|jgi:CDP-glucose 4,6-dehydratase|nr:CDP-glucose 4,6-dehydratase [Pirellulales bacterium]
MNSRFWRNRRVFVTGHTGFKGSWLCLMLERLGARTTGYALPPPSDPSLFRLARVDEAVETVEGDVRDYAAVERAMRAAKPEVVIHMAAQALVRPSYRDPISTYGTNVMGTVHVLEAVRHVGGVRAIVNVTSDKCYRNNEAPLGYREHEPMGGHDPYSSSKGCAELVTDAYRRSYFSGSEGAKDETVLASARAGNVIGGGDWAEDRLIPDVVRSCLKGQSVEIRNPAAIRPWQLVLEPLNGYLMLAERLYEQGNEFAEGWNFGPREEDARPVDHVVSRITQLWGDGASWHVSAGRHPHEARYLKLDCAKARNRFGWRPHTDLETGLRWTVEWYRRIHSGADARNLSNDHIRRFLELADETAARVSFENMAISSNVT